MLLKIYRKYITSSILFSEHVISDVVEVPGLFPSKPPTPVVIAGGLIVVQEVVRGPRPRPGLRAEVAGLSPGVGGGGGGGDLLIRSQDTGPVTLP